MDYKLFYKFYKLILDKLLVCCYYLNFYVYVVMLVDDNVY